MANSLQEQLQQAGLISEGKAKQHKQRARKRKRRAGGGDEAAKLSAQTEAAQAAKQAHDRALNAEREQARKRKEAGLQLQQLLRSQRANDPKGTERYNFAIGQKLKSIYVNNAQREGLAAGALAVVVFDEGLYLVPSEVISKAQAIEPALLFYRAEKAASADADEAADDPYAGYEVPDDLMW